MLDLPKDEEQRMFVSRLGSCWLNCIRVVPYDRMLGEIAEGSDKERTNGGESVSF